MLFIVMKKVCSPFSILNCEMHQRNKLCSCAVSVFHHIYFYFWVGKPFSVIVMKEKNKLRRYLIPDSILPCWMCCFLSTPPTLSTENCGHRYHCWGKMDVKKHSPTKGQL